MLNIPYFRAFRCKWYILNNKDNLRKIFNAKSNECIFLTCSSHCISYVVFNRTLVVEKSMHIIFDDTNDSLQRKNSYGDEMLEASKSKDNKKKEQVENKDGE